MAVSKLPLAVKDTDVIFVELFVVNNGAVAGVGGGAAASQVAQSTKVSDPVGTSILDIAETDVGV